MADKIIVVDDEREIADLIGLYLENDGYEVHKFLNGADALSFVEKCEPALAVLDVMLPDTDGFALLRKMREKHDFPIIMLTARVTDSDKIFGRKTSQFHTDKRINSAPVFATIAAKTGALFAHGRIL